MSILETCTTVSIFPRPLALRSNVVAESEDRICRRSCAANITPIGDTPQL